jgi:hypothetical protein
MTTPDYDRRYLEAAFEVLEDYLKSPALYWPLDVKPPKGAPPYPQLTPGNVLLALRRLEAHDAVGDFSARLRAFRGQWGAHWRQKAAREAQARLRQWRNYLRETTDRAPYYHYEVSERVILELLAEDLGALPPGVATDLAALDRLLRGAFQEGDFVWEAPLARAFPPDRFWFLYGTLQEA